MTDDSAPLPSETPEQGDLFDAASRLKLDCNDTGNAKRLAAVLQGEARYVVGRGWGVWDSRRYNFEGGSARMLALAGCLQRLHEEEAAALDTIPVSQSKLQERMAEKGEDEATATRRIKAERRRKRFEYAKGCGNIARIRNAIELAAASFLVDVAALDRDRSVLQVENGTLDLAALATAPEAEEDHEREARWQGALRPHDRSVLPTRVASVPFDPMAQAPEWRRFIGLIQPDAEERDYLQRCMGAMLGGRRGEWWLAMLGPGGSGKSTCMRALEAVMGDYFQPCRIDMILEHRNSGGLGPTPEEAVLPGARIYSAQEPREGATLDAGKIKGLTDGSKRQANPKNKDLFNYIPVGVLVMQANKMPRINDASGGFWRRCNIVQFHVLLEDLPADEQRSEEYMAAAIDGERPGILNWLLEGYAMWRADGLRPPARVLALKGSLRALADPVGQFLEEKTEKGIGRSVRTSELHKAFQKWCEAQGDKPMSAKAFTATMLAMDYERFKRDVWFWRGLELTDRSLLEGD